MTTSATGEAVSYPAAELDRRFYAFALDRLVAWGIFAGASYLSWRFLLDDDMIAAGVGVIVAAVLVVSLVYAVLLGVAGISPGKAAVGLRVVRMSDGRPMGVGAGLLRTLVLGIATLPVFGLGVATLAWTALADPSGRRRGAHDRWTKAVVVDVRPAPDDDGEVVERPRQIVNLTAMRLMPAPPPDQIRVPARAERPATTPPVSRPSSPPPAAPPPSAPAPPPAPSRPAPQVAPRHAAPATTTPPPTPPPPRRPLPPTPQPPATTPPQAPLGPPLATPRAEQAAAPRRVAGWRVTFDTGETFVVEGLALVGRRPEARAGEPVKHLVPLRSSDMSVSKTHAQFQVVPDGALVVMDRGSTNGSVVVRKGVSKPLTAGRPATLLDGDTVRFGDRSMSVTKDDGA